MNPERFAVGMNLAPNSRKDKNLNRKYRIRKTITNLARIPG
jgi:hypothetical protein